MSLRPRARGPEVASKARERAEEAVSEGITSPGSSYGWWKKKTAKSLGMYKNPVNNGIKYQCQLVLAGFVPATVSQELPGEKNRWDLLPQTI